MLLDAIKRLVGLFWIPIQGMMQVELLEINGYPVTLFGLVIAPIIIGFAFMIILIIGKGGTKSDD